MNRFTWIVAAYCVLLSGCADDGLQDVLPSRTVTRNVRIAACVPSTRTELAPDGYNVLWSPGDRIGVYVKSGDTFTAENVPLAFEGRLPEVFSAETLPLRKGRRSTRSMPIIPIRNRRPRMRPAWVSRWRRSRCRRQRAIRRTWGITTSWSPMP